MTNKETAEFKRLLLRNQKGLAEITALVNNANYVPVQNLRPIDLELMRKLQESTAEMLKLIKQHS
jgi:hypothetical protein